MKAKKPKLTKWSRKKPQRVGEYNASRVRSTSVLRWWDGEYWSYPYYADTTEHAKRIKRRTRYLKHDNSMEWRGLVEEPHYPFPPGPLEKL